MKKRFPGANLEWLVHRLTGGFLKGRSLCGALAAARRNHWPMLMVDVKRRSPRDGVLIPDDRLDGYVRTLVAAGVDALSTPTDGRHFGGSLETARRIRELADVPLLRKEFFASPDQMDESLAAGFDAVQLTLSTIPELGVARAMKARAEEIGLEVVVCVHSEEQLRAALDLNAAIIGIANRDITILELDNGDVTITEKLIAMVPHDVYTISESALRNESDVAQAAAAGADGVLVGTAMAKSDDPASMVRALRGVPAGGH